MCPDVVVAEIDPKKLKKQTVNVSVSNVHKSCGVVKPCGASIWKKNQLLQCVGLHFTVQ